MQWITCADPEGDRGFRSPLKNNKNITFLSNTGPDTLKNHKATMPAMLGHHWHVSERFRWRADDGPLLGGIRNQDPLFLHKK